MFTLFFILGTKNFVAIGLEEVLVIFLTHSAYILKIIFLKEIAVQPLWRPRAEAAWVPHSHVSAMGPKAASTRSMADRGQSRVEGNIL